MSAPALMFFPVTDTAGILHLVSEEAMTAGRLAGCYLAVCGNPVLAASLTTPERSSCRSCAEGVT
ncbi:MAG: hypothetical protein ACRDTG_12975 [Pseudonocardiaceae bacterium]